MKSVLNLLKHITEGSEELKEGNSDSDESEEASMHKSLNQISKNKETNLLNPILL